MTTTIRKGMQGKLGAITIPASALLSAFLLAAPLGAAQAAADAPANSVTQDQLKQESERREASEAKIQEQIDAMPPTYQVGDMGPGGGIVFHVYDQGRHGLEVSRHNLANAASWSGNKELVTSAIRDGINGGLWNTERIVIAQGDGHYAAQLAADYEGGGYGDWYLPSAEEMNLLYWVQFIDHSLDLEYWTSTEIDRDLAYIQSMFGGELRPRQKYADYPVRAIRRF